MKRSESDRVPLTKKVAYAAPAFALAIVGVPVYVYIPKFYTDVVGVNIAMLGYLLLAVRLFDAVTDPAIGFLSDKTQTRFGRRRPYIASGSIFLSLTMYFLFNPPEASIWTRNIPIMHVKKVPSEAIHLKECNLVKLLQDKAWIVDVKWGG